jgi:hypothetical protein
VGILVSVSDPAARLGAAGERPAPAWRGVVLVLSAEGEQDDLMRDAMVRMSGELGAALFQVVSRAIDPRVDLMLQVETAGADLDPVAAFAIVRDPGAGPGGIAVWVSNRTTRMTTVQHVRLRTADGDRAAAQLAVETVELVRAAIVGLRPEPPAAAPSGSLSEAAAAGGRSAAGPRVGLAVGVGLFDDFDGAPASWAPVLAVTYGRPDGIQLRIGAAGLGPGSELSLSDGTSVRLQRQLLSAGVLRRFRSDQRIQFLLSAAGGLHHLGAEGAGASADRDHSRSSYSAALTAGVGAAVALAPHLALTAEADALMLSRTASVAAGGQDVAHLNRPALFARGGLLATF